MSTFVVDLSNYKERVGSLIDAGRYTFVIEDAELSKSSKGSFMLEVWLRVFGGDFDGRTVTDRFVYLDASGQPSKALFRLVNLMESLGIPTPRKRLELNVRQFIGRQVGADVEDGAPYNGKIRSEVSGYLKLGGTAQASAAAASDGLEEFAAEPTNAELAVEPAPPVEPAQPQVQAPPAAPPTNGAVQAAPQQQVAQAPLPQQVDLDSIDLGTL